MRLLRFRRGQIRGIDFSLSIIIFSLTITQIMILTTTFIDGNRTLIQQDQQQEVTETLATEFLHTNGYYSLNPSWATISTPDLIATNWNLGLTTNGAIDPFKLGRLSNRSLTDWVLSYEDIQQGLNFSSSLSIEVLNPIDIQIESVQDDFANTITVNGSVTKLNKPLNLAEVWVYSVNSSQDIAQGFSMTSIDGEFSIDLTYSSALVVGDYFSVVAFAKFGGSSQDADITDHVIGSLPGSIPNSTPISVFESAGGRGYGVNVTNEFDPAVFSGSIIAFYPGITSGTLNYTIASLTQNLTSGFWTNDAVGIPQDGMIVFLGMGLDVDDNLISLSTVKFPVTLDNQHSASIEPPLTQQSTSTTRLMTFTVRGLLLQLQFTTWEF